MKTQVTLFNLKIKGSRALRQLATLGGIMLAIAMIGVILAAVQIAVCHRDQPERPALSCLKGGR